MGIFFGIVGGVLLVVMWARPSQWVLDFEESLKQDNPGCSI